MSISLSKSTAKSPWTSAAVWAIRVLSLVLIAGVLLSTTQSNQWWVRVWDFPRFQLLVVMVVFAAILWRSDEPWRPWLPLALIALSIWQAIRILPYTPVMPADVEMVSDTASRQDSCLSILSLNVLQTNRDYASTLDVIERVDPDILLLMETDQAWVEAVQPITSAYPQVLSKALDNKYGILFASKLPLKDSAVRDLAQKDTPSVITTVSLGDFEVKMLSLHPRPPRPGQDTEERDAELIVAAELVRESNLPAIAIGDFNDVAWSDTTRLFMQTSEMLDPRIGRGTFATFPSDKTWLGWPLDHVFVTDGFLLRKIEVLEHVGSDHRPILVELCLDPDQARRHNAQTEDATAQDKEDAEEIKQEFEAEQEG